MKRRRGLLWMTTVVLVVCAACSVWLRGQQQQYTLNRQLIAALSQSDTKTALALVNAGADPNTRYEPTPAPTLKLLFDQLLHRRSLPVNNNPTAFIIACGTMALPRLHERNILLTMDEDLPLLRAMLAHGANVHARVFPDRAAMHTAVLKDRLHTIELLLQHGADVNEQDRYGQTPLIVAVRDSNGEIARLLLSHGAHPNAQDRRGNTALRSAVASPIAASLLPELLASGADPNVGIRYGLTPLQYAQKMKRSDLLALMRHSGK
jgi:hypothetical protein